jgi:tetratricopeptide (TPR) repeat protein
VVSNLGTVLTAKGDMPTDKINQYMLLVVQALNLENDGDKLCRLRGDYANGMVCYRKALSLEEQGMGELHPTTCDLYLRTADALGQLGDLEASLVEYKHAIQIYERIMGKFHVKVAQIYTKLAGILMDKGNFETALSFYAKAYGIYDAVLGNHDDTKSAMMNMRLAAAKERTAKEFLKKLDDAEADFKLQQQIQRLEEEEILNQEAESIQVAGKMKPKKEKDEEAKKEEPKPPTPEPDDII